MQFHSQCPATLGGAEPDVREEFSNSSRPPDGEIYRKIRLYQPSDEAGEDRWLARLTPGKTKCFSQLERRPELCAAFDRLLPITGLWAGMRLGTLHKLLALHCDEVSQPASRQLPSRRG
jgi:Protein of unknown function (DUF3723)